MIIIFIQKIYALAPLGKSDHVVRTCNRN